MHALKPLDGQILSAGVQFVGITHPETMTLRWVLIVSGSTDGVLYMAEDDMDLNRHVGVFSRHDLVAVVSLIPQIPPYRSGTHMLRFYALAVHPVWQQHGIGTALMSELLQRARNEGAVVLWGNARRSSHGFFAQTGFTVEDQGVINPATGMMSNVVWQDIAPAANKSKTTRT